MFITGHKVNELVKNIDKNLNYHEKTPTKQDAIIVEEINYHIEKLSGMPLRLFLSFTFGISIRAVNPISYGDGFWPKVGILSFPEVISIYVRE